MSTANGCALASGDGGDKDGSFRRLKLLWADLLVCLNLCFKPSLSFSSYIQLQSVKAGGIYYLVTSKQNMSRRNGNVPKLELKLNLSPPRANRMESPSRSATVSPTSPPSSCVSSENQEDTLSPEATSMLLVGCPRCLMYVMLSEDDPKCPKCKSTVLLDFLHDSNITTTTTTNNNNSKTRKS
ncbi:hypothetical protein LWI28_020175 [Acer negundo]|uniref:GIR1-like zinc ribbon domain-containing protein n=1 Tax=Acer negundo TaxID=4023 RepID=A0AAD5NF50_ACENE|nr:hypothetical protein LWI28_020175 [Acer negundo]